jgi:excinuclease UvrABC nuclease subunit
MIYEYSGHYDYNQQNIIDWNSNAIGIYYCGYIMYNGNFIILYVGRAIGQGGIRERLLQHLRDDNWPGVTHFAFVVCSTAQEAIDYEAMEITRLQPAYNIQSK